MGFWAKTAERVLYMLISTVHTQQGNKFEIASSGDGALVTISRNPGAKATQPSSAFQVELLDWEVTELITALENSKV